MKAVRYVGKGTKLGSDYRDAVRKGSRTVIVNTLLDGGNVTVRLKLDGKALEIENDSITRDFLDISTLIYIVDEIDPRKRSKDHWSRRFDVIAPVKEPKRWMKHEASLRKMLHTLAGDDYRFNWLKRPELDSLGRHRVELPKDFDAVCLFSGGMDSFLGAYQLLSAGKKLLLVGHQADGTAASAQSKLATWLQGKFPEACHLIQCRVARSHTESPKFRLPSKKEDTHRVRSLLFIALAVSIANAGGIAEIYLPENGLISLNAPLQKSRIGTLSTRTAHPRYLGELLDFLNGSGIFTGFIKNPFIFLSKTDMLVRKRSLAEPLRRSVSCARPSRYKNKGVRHCGYCVPCIYRRIAMLESELDSSSEYAFSIFEDLEALDVGKQLDFRALVRWSRNVIKSTPLERELIVLSHGSFPLSAGERFGLREATSYAAWGDMLLRWARDFLEKLELHAGDKVKRSLDLPAKKARGRV